MSKKQAVPMQLPFAPMEWWKVIQGNNNSAGTHKGVNSYAYDFVRANGSSEGAPVYATATGEIIDLDDSLPSAGPVGDHHNGIKIEHAAGEVCVPIHLKQSSITSLGLKVGDTVQMGQQIAAVGDTGTGIGNFHLHIALSNEPIPTPDTYETMPSEFMDYDVSNDNGQTWTTVKKGTPQEGQWVRRRSLWGPWTLLEGKFIGAPAVRSRQPTITDVFVRAPDGTLWQRSCANGKWWANWQPHNDGFILGSSPVADSMGPDHLQLFARGKDGGLWQKGWTTSGGWSAWKPLEGVFIDEPAAFSRQSTITDVFVRAPDNTLWQRSCANGTWWPKWQPSNDGFVLGSAPVADSMGADHLQLFARGQDGKLWQKWWTASGGWSAWTLREGLFVGAPAVRSRQPTITDVFVRAPDHTLWQRSCANGNWWPQWQPHNDGFLLGSPPVADSMGPNHLQLFARGKDGKLWQKRWQT
jgi:hypothetical protein